MFKLWKAILASSTIAVAAVALPAAASANTAWVSNTETPKPPYNSCTHPGYNHIQQAIEAPTTAIRVCPGTYEEQLQIERPITITAPEGEPVVKLPASPQNSTTPCDKAINPSEYQPNQDAVSICTSGTVSITGLKIEALWPASTCYDSMYGIFVAGGGTLKATKVTVDGAGPTGPIDGCQGGVGIEVGTARTEPAEVGHATLSTDTVSGYQKNGITDEGEGTSISVTSAIVTGAGETPAIAQNGIQVSYGAKGTITKSTITGNECNASSCGENALSDYQSTGVLFYLEAKGSNVTNSTISGNDIGAYQAAAAEEGSPQATISGNLMENDRYETVVLDQGFTAVSKNKMINGDVGIQLLQYSEQTVGIRGTGTEDEISGMKRYAIEGLSDKEPADQFGSLTISKSKISGNPSGLAESIFTNNPTKLKVFTNKTDF